MANTDVPRPPTFEEVRSASTLQAAHEAMREWHNRMYDWTLAYAHELEKGLRNAEGGNRLLMGLDKRAAARSVVRPLLKAAGWHADQAKMWMQVPYRFADRFQGTSNGRHSRRTFDVNK